MSRLHDEPDAERDAAPAAAHRLAVEQVIAAMREQLDRPLPLPAMAELAHLSPYHFSRVFRQVTGIPPGEFLSALRLAEAKRLLLATDLSVTDICFEVGYTSIGTFTTRFTQLVGLSPLQLRRLSDELSAVLARPPASDVAWRPTPTAAGVVGHLSAPDMTAGLIFVGLFPSAIPQRRPVAGAFLTRPGLFHLRDVPPGRYHLLAAALPATGDPAACLLPGAVMRVGRSQGVVAVRPGRVSGFIPVTLRPLQATDPPVLVTLPALLIEQAARQRASTG